VREFGWTFESAENLDRLRSLSVERNVVAVFFEPAALAMPWERALASIKEAAPHALPILCHRFSESLPWDLTAEAGVFHSLSVPFDLREIQQSLGFVWSAIRKRGVPLHRPAPQRRRSTKIR